VENVIHIDTGGKRNTPRGVLRFPPVSICITFSTSIEVYYVFHLYRSVLRFPHVSRYIKFSTCIDTCGKRNTHLDRGGKRNTPRYMWKT
jgi:hypothetical protein